MNKLDLRTVNVAKYLQPLGGGGSLSAIVLDDDNFQYVLKFRVAGQGVNALIDEFIGGGLARANNLQKVMEKIYLKYVL